MPPPEPTDAELLAFLDETLASLHPRLREPEVLAEAIGHHRDLWLELYRASLGLQVPDAPTTVVRREPYG